VQPHLAIFAAIILGSRFVIADQTADVLIDDNRLWRWWRRKIAHDFNPLRNFGFVHGKFTMT
jgi:hypothetical protein